MMVQRKRERQALVNDLLEQDWNVFGTLKFIFGDAGSGCEFFGNFADHSRYRFCLSWVRPIPTETMQPGM